MFTALVQKTIPFTIVKAKIEADTKLWQKRFFLIFIYSLFKGVLYSLFFQFVTILNEVFICIPILICIHFDYVIS